MASNLGPTAELTILVRSAAGLDCEAKEQRELAGEVISLLKAGAHLRPALEIAVESDGAILRILAFSASELGPELGSRVHDLAILLSSSDDYVRFFTVDSMIANMGVLSVAELEPVGRVLSSTPSPVDWKAMKLLAAVSDEAFSIVVRDSPARERVTSLQALADNDLIEVVASNGSASRWAAVTLARRGPSPAMIEELASNHPSESIRNLFRFLN